MASRLDLKYRPRKFSEVIGNEGVVQLLLKRSQGETLSNQSMLFGGPKGVGKTTLARIVAAAMVCTDKQDGEPCGVCSSCLSVADGSSNCVEELDAASQGTVDRIRTMVSDSEYETLDGIGNIYILDEAQRLSPSSQDAMLKAVEDRSIVVLMCTTEPHKIRAAIRSRLEEYPISSPTTDEMVKRLQEICSAEQIQFDIEALKSLSKNSQNCPRVCIRSVETMSVLGPVDADAVRKFLRFDSYETVNKVLSSIDENPKHALGLLDDLFNKEGETWVRDAMVFAIASGLRVDIGAGHNYPCNPSFFKTRLRNWSEFACQIGMMDRPTASGILSSLLSTKPNFVSSTLPSAPPAVLPSPTPPVVPPPPLLPSNIFPKPISPPKSDSSPLKPPTPSAPPSALPLQMEIDGVRFSSNENLTTLDSKIEGSFGNKDAEPELVPIVRKPGMEPMSEGEFARMFISRMKR